MMIGKLFCLGILVQNEILFDLEQNYGIPTITKNQAMKELIASGELLGLGDRFPKEDDIMSSGSGSDSDPT
jgi:hypothetical protein